MSAYKRSSAADVDLAKRERGTWVAIAQLMTSLDLSWTIWRLHEPFREEM